MSQLFKIKSDTHKEEVIGLLQTLISDNQNCDYKDSWIQLWEDVINILENNTHNFDVYRNYFIEWCDKASTKCSLYSLQKAQILRLNLLKLLL